MADITIGTTGRQFFQIDSTLAAILVECGIANYLKPAKEPLIPQWPQGWSLVFVGPKQIPTLQLVRGSEVFPFDRLPLPRIRRWNPAKQEHEVVGVDVDCPLPPELKAEFEALTRPFDPDAASERKRIALEKLQTEQDRQNKGGQ
jgi:hypothetical protein